MLFYAFDEIPIQKQMALILNEIHKRENFTFLEQLFISINS
jgi:hypothetical protein